MCGIAGFIGTKEIERNRINNCLNLMKTRGPDNSTFREFEFKGINKCYLLHSRLSIIDLSERSNQPFYFDNLVLIFNGEIFNYIELKKELKQEGYTFDSKSDTEVLLKAYHCWKEKAFDKLEGMWAFSIYNTTTGELILSRDRFAEKPLYYFEDKQGIYFASEIKYIDAMIDEKLEVNYNQINRYIVNGYKSLYKHNESFLNHVKELDFASYMIISNDLNKKENKYWRLQSNVNHNLTFNDAVSSVRDLLIHSLSLRLRSDTPVAFCLSGGIDSASLASIAVKKLNKKISTFSIIDHDERYNEQENIQATINDLKCDHTFIHLNNSNDIINKLESLVKYHDGPLATISYLIHSFLSENISKQGFKVSISGTGADELLTGYYDHFNLHLSEITDSESHQKKLLDWNQYIQPLVRNPFLQDPDLYIKNPEFRSHIYLNNEEFSKYLNTEFSEEFREEKYSDILLHNRMLNELFHEGTRVILHEDDLNSMMNSIENRSPYLDRALSEFCYTIPTDMLIDNGYGKIILRESMNGILNDKVRLDRHKKGFNTSILSIFDFNNKNIKEKILDSSSAFDVINKKRVENLLSKSSLKNSESKLLFNIINVKLFLDARSEF